MSIRRLFPRVWIQTDALSLLFLGLLERQTLHRQPTIGTPVEVPQPKMVSVLVREEAFSEGMPHSLGLGDRFCKAIRKKLPIVRGSHWLQTRLS